MGLKEILAAKKAAAEALENKQPEIKIGEVKNDADVQPNEDQQPANVEQPTIAVSPLDLSTGNESSAAAKPATEQPVLSNVQAGSNSGKPLSFAEKMALKKQGISAAQSAPVAAKPIAVIDPAMIPEDAADAQAYVDIKQRIEELEALFEDDLKNAMSELKAALKKNPNAAELMLDQDVGKMVIALRKMTQTAQVVAETTKKATKGKAPKAKDVALTKEQIEAAFDEL